MYLSLVRHLKNSSSENHVAYMFDTTVTNCTNPILIVVRAVMKQLCLLLTSLLLTAFCIAEVSASERECLGVEIIREDKRTSSELYTFNGAFDFTYSMLRHADDLLYVEYLDSNLNLVHTVYVDSIPDKIVVVTDINDDGVDDISAREYSLLQREDGSFTKLAHPFGQRGPFEFADDVDFDGMPDHSTGDVKDYENITIIVRYLEFEGDSLALKTVTIPTPSNSCSFVGCTTEFGPYDSVYVISQLAFGIEFPEDSIMFVSNDSIVGRQSIEGFRTISGVPGLFFETSDASPSSMLFHSPEGLRIAGFFEDSVRVSTKSIPVESYNHRDLIEIPYDDIGATHMFAGGSGLCFFDIHTLEVFAGCSFSSVGKNYAFLGKDTKIVVSNVGDYDKFYRFKQKKTQSLDVVTLEKLTADPNNFRVSVTLESTNERILDFVEGVSPVVSFRGYPDPSINPLTIARQEGILQFTFDVSGRTGDEVVITFPRGPIDEELSFAGGFVAVTIPSKPSSCEFVFLPNDSYTFQNTVETYTGPDRLFDVNGDGLLDIVTNASHMWHDHMKAVSTRSLALNTGSMDMLWEQQAMHPRDPYVDFIVEIVDIDGDGTPELFEPERRRLYQTFEDYVQKVQYDTVLSNLYLSNTQSGNLIQADWDLDGKAELRLTKAIGVYWDIIESPQGFDLQLNYNGPAPLLAMWPAMRSDFNSNGVQDIVTSTDGYIGIIETGYQLPPRNVYLTASVESLCLADLDNDGTKEILTIEENDNGGSGLFVYKHTIDLSFTRYTIAEETSLYAVGPVGDFNGDGVDDVIIRSEFSGSIAFGTSSLLELEYSSIDFPVLKLINSSFFIRGDLDNDGDLDVIASEGVIYSPLSLTTFFNCSYTAPPVSVQKEHEMDVDLRIDGQIVHTLSGSPLQKLQIYNVLGVLLFDQDVPTPTLDLSTVLVHSGVYFVVSGSNSQKMIFVK